ncbi:uncharacterized protein MONOS_14467 [Monocercomonoides exilis]|uniref:uncharacterized protein n=1 Tax=Monocercomonoides exilis TaxID=2049356 RepID=UPI00355A0280|nr:hypothetical protein MONOS_14467 [Monocercomonoides exilis]|eukprot:MONOS_14467.1-p1 / transcript=MONOS_14467.1 / gene=MONOS_14467 / organism=Monocercomonoides_exilis_PA203 / gene_product=unspecified product / transcript_product=unspecified product / location=Mono_scaffold01007:2993-3481(-) / protein_length=108 / sequence_SO=supercontig / SO=protein_coding / is_pseudo=false
MFSSSCLSSGEACRKITSVQMKSLLCMCNPQIAQALLLWTFRDAFRLSVCCPPSFASICVKMDESVGWAEMVSGCCAVSCGEERRAEGTKPNGAAASGIGGVAAEEK